MWNGKTVRIIVHPTTKKKDGFINEIGYTTMHHVKSFHKEGSKHVSKTTPYLKSYPTHFLKTTFAIITLLPALLLGSFFKGISVSYDAIRASFSETIPNYFMLLRQHFTASPRIIGSSDCPLDKSSIIARIDEMKEYKGLNHKTNHFVVYGNGVTFESDPGFFSFGEKKVILIGIKFDESVRFNTDEYPPISWHQNITTVKEAIENEDLITYHKKNRQKIHRSLPSSQKCKLMLFSLLDFFKTLIKASFERSLLTTRWEFCDH